MSRDDRNEGVAPHILASPLGDLITRDEEPKVLRHLTKRASSTTAACGASGAIYTTDSHYSTTCEACLAAWRKLTPTQLAALRQLAERPRSPWDFGSTTVRKLRALGYAESVNAALKITDAGRAALRSAS